MNDTRFATGRLRRAVYDPNTRQLDLHFADGKVLAYGHVPAEVVRRLRAAPTPATFWEDRIAEEYSSVRPQRPGSASAPANTLGGDNAAAKPSLSDLFKAAERADSED